MLDDVISVSSSPSHHSSLGALQRNDSKAAVVHEECLSQAKQPRVLLDDYSSSSSGSSGSPVLDIPDTTLDSLRILPADIQLKENQQLPSWNRCGQGGALAPPIGMHSSQNATDRIDHVARWATHDSAQAVLDVAFATERALQELEAEMQLQHADTQMVRFKHFQTTVHPLILL